MPSVLIVDDDTDLLEMVDLVLSNAGMNANCIYDAATLFDSVTHIRPDIVVMDVFLGEQDGRSLCYSLKTSENFKDIPIILYSAGIISGESVRNALADAFLIKPFNIHALIAKIKELTIKN
ncbi:MAG: response regulator [Bacteroidota bacterium]